MPQQKIIIVPVQLHPEYVNHSGTHSAVLPSELICMIKMLTIEISFFDGTDTARRVDGYEGLEPWSNVKLFSMTIPPCKIF